jgi:hypothetical protein
MQQMELFLKNYEMDWRGVQIKIKKGLEISFIHKMLYAQYRYAYGCHIKGFVNLLYLLSIITFFGS